MKVATVMIIAASIAALGCRVMDKREQATGSAVRIGSEVSCRSCSIVVDSVVTIEGAYLGGPAARIARDKAGMFYLVDGGDKLLKVYASDGRFVRQIGRQGGGPGEYELIRNVMVAPAGSINVLDATLGRLSAYSPNGQFLSSAQVPVARGFGMPAAFLSDGSLVVNIQPTTPADTGHTLRLIGQHGNDVRPLDEATFDPTKRWLQRRVLWPRAGGGLLVGRPFTFTIEVYGSDLAKVTSITRVDTWIPLHDPEEMPSDGLFDKTPTPQLDAMWEDAQGLLWLDMVVPSPDWTPGPPREEVMRRQTATIRETGQTLSSRPRYETIIEVVDVERRSVLARYRQDSSIGAPFGWGYFAHGVENSAGVPSLRISRVQLRR
jgi:hypothetical protein